MKTSERWCIINAEMNNKRIEVLASALVGCIFTLSAQDLTMKITKRYLNLPVSHQVDRALMTFDGEGGKSGCLRFVWPRENRTIGCFAICLP